MICFQCMHFITLRSCLEPVVVPARYTWREFTNGSSMKCTNTTDDCRDSLLHISVIGCGSSHQTLGCYISKGRHHKHNILVYKLRALMGWCIIKWKNKSASIWHPLLCSKDGNIINWIFWMVERFLGSKWRYGWSSPLLSRIKVLVNMKPNPEESLPMFESAAKSLKILVCWPNTAAKFDHKKP